MKKIVLMAFMALSVAAFAQQANPVTLQLEEVNLDSLRTLYLSEPFMYRASLNTLAQALNKNGEELKALKAELKAEKAHAKELNNAIKKATQMTEAIKKLYVKEENELKKMQKTVENQQRSLNKQRALGSDTRDSYTQFLDKQQKELGYSLREVAERQRVIAELQTAIQNGRTNLSIYEQQLIQKAGTITVLETQLKERTATVKAEQKNAKGMQ